MITTTTGTTGRTTTTSTTTTSNPLIIVVPPQIPQGGTCTIDQSSGNALQTLFTITCSGWYDPDGTIVKYEYFVSYKNNQSILNIGNNATGYFYSQLPPGDTSDSNRLYVFVQIIDDSGSMAVYYITAPVIVPLQSSTLINNANDILSMTSGSYIVSCITSSDISVASSGIIAFWSSLNQLISSGSLPSASLDLTQIQNIAQIFTSSLDSYSLTSFSSIKAASSALSVVSSYTDLLSSTTASQIVDMCNKMTDNLVSTASEYSLSYVSQTAEYLIDASANSIQSLNVQSQDTSTLRNAAASQINVVDTITNIIASQLSVGDSQIITKNNINLEISKSVMSSIQTLVSDNGCSMEFSDVCAIVGQPSGSCSGTVIIQQTYSRVSALNLNAKTKVGESSSISRSFYMPDMTEYQVSDYSAGFYFWFSTNSAASVSFELVNTSNLTISSSNQLQTYMTQLTTPDQSITVEIKPSDTSSVGYLVALRYGNYPVINSSEQSFTILQVYCPSSKLEFY